MRILSPLYVFGTEFSRRFQKFLEYFKKDGGFINCQPNSFKKVFTKINNNEKNNNIDMFTIRKENIKRTFNKTEQSGRELINGIYYPIDYKINDI